MGALRMDNGGEHRVWARDQRLLPGEQYQQHQELQTPGLKVLEEQEQANRSQKRNRKRPPTESPSAKDWQELITDLGRVRVKEAAVPLWGAQHSRSSSAHSSLITRTKRVLDEPTATGNIPSYLRTVSTDSFDDDDYGDDDDLALGAPPLLPPQLKRARAASYSPTTSRSMLAEKPAQKCSRQ